MSTVFELSTGAHGRVRVVRVRAAAALTEAVHLLELPASSPSLVLVGGAGSVDDAARIALRPLFMEGLAPAVEHVGAVVVDGGTDAGIMALMGTARAQIGARFPLVGVAAEGTVVLPGDAVESQTDAALIEPHHSHLLLVPGNHFGEESPWIADMARAIAGDQPSVTVLVGGGKIAWEDVANSAAMGRPIIVVAGSGGTADAVAAALSNRDDPGRALSLPSGARFQVVRAVDGPGALREAVEAALSRPDAIPAQGLSEQTHRGAFVKDSEAALEEMIGLLDLPEAKKQFIEGRWLDQIRWMEKKAASCQRKYHWSRMIVIVAAAFVPVLTTTAASLDAGPATTVVHAVSIIVSLVVTIAAAWEEFFRNGDRWRHYRHTVEQLKSEGWLYFERSGPYAEYPNHARAHAAFVLRVEQILGQDVERFLTQIAVEKKKQAKDDGATEGKLVGIAMTKVA